MIVRSQSEVQSLDDELNLFEEADWDFMSVVGNRDNNFEYFNDIRDADFEVKHRSVKDYLSYAALCVAFIAIVATVAINVTGIFDNEEYAAVSDIQSMQSGMSVTQYVEGAVASSDELVEVSNILTSYFGCLRDARDYHGLDNYCSARSAFSNRYYGLVSSSTSIYDTSDCFARGLREFSSHYKFQRLNSVIKSDDLYYCYATIEYSTIYDVIEFVNSNSQSFVQKFQGGKNITESQVAKFLLEVMAEKKIPTSVNEVCLPFSKIDGVMLMTSDNDILLSASEAYNVALNQLLKLLDGMLTN